MGFDGAGRAGYSQPAWDEFVDEYDAGERAGRTGQRPRGMDGRFPDDRSPDERLESSGEHRGKGPKGWRRSDERLREEVSEALAHDGHLDAGEITVEVSDGEVTLTGSVATRADKRRAESCVDSVLGVVDVQNQLRLDRGAER